MPVPGKGRLLPGVGWRMSFPVRRAPYFVYRISINVADMRETLDAMHDMIENHLSDNPEQNSSAYRC